MLVELVPVFLIDKVWPELADGFHRALMKTGGDCASSDLWVQARSGSAFVFIARDDKGELYGASLFRFETWPTGHRIRCLAMFGRDMDRWYDAMEAEVTRVGRAGGATSMVSEGRPGWKRNIPGAKVLRFMYEKTI